MAVLAVGNRQRSLQSPSDVRDVIKLTAVITEQHLASFELLLFLLKGDNGGQHKFPGPLLLPASLFAHATGSNRLPQLPTVATLLSFLNLVTLTHQGMFGGCSSQVYAQRVSSDALKDCGHVKSWLVSFQRGEVVLAAGR